LIIGADVCTRISVVIVGPGNFFAVLHLYMLVQSFYEMLRASMPGSQELHHNAKRHIPQKIQQFTPRFYLINTASQGNACPFNKTRIDW
jgi:hypothetical protein